MASTNRELAAALKMFSRFFDLIHQPLAVINERGEYVYYNQESADLDGYTIERAMGKHLLDVYPTMKESQSTMLSSLKNGEEFIGHYQIYYNARGQAVDYQHSTAPLYNSQGEMVGVIEIGRDMSGVRRLQQQVVELNSLLYADRHEKHHAIVTENPEMLSNIEKGKRMAASAIPVTIVGETGTGKELFSRLIHQYSPRADKPFIALNCGALPPTLIESTLFGSVRGAFTGAENSQGYLELANGGTLFLDELNAMPMEMQSKLLRFLQEKTFWKLGGQHQQSSDVRIVAAMNEAPLELIQKGRLRADLFYRLSVGMLTLPPLSKRPEDIPLLANYFIDKYRNDVPQEIYGLSEKARLALVNHPWPGNVRMLENAIVRSMVMQEEDGPLKTIVFEEDSGFDLNNEEPETNRPPAAAMYEAKGSLEARVAQYEKSLIEAALDSYQGNIAAAARSLNISRTTLQYKVRKYGIRFGVIHG
ncbi:sigma-54 interaction domain-containing protein [Mixta intestinalis]|jgi:arginine utilization regulatory protein|uniref:Arginine utilization regulatory protein RocR n=1 Tax=Mixta intestinalis TaxID=1615494 RepID=A0A6P1Q4A4_9GAMM|nr:sigma-54-dependent Fis family transcriptional regulator [Mixta intestinalis]QHM73826.1 Arginine utilization regulatory protein RocR [Mixta intestinalis]